MDEPYKPIACALHERLEFSVLRGLVLDLSWEEAGELQRARVRPRDVYTRDGAEWLDIRLDDGCGMTLRLDRIRAFSERPGN